MDALRNRLGAALAHVADAGAAIVAALSPRSMAKWEVRRLAAAGYLVGQRYDVDFSLAFDGEVADATLPAVRRAGFTVGDRDRQEKGFVTVRRRTRLRAYDISRAANRLNRVVTPHGGFAAVIGPTNPPAGTGLVVVRAR